MLNLQLCLHIQMLRITLFNVMFLCEYFLFISCCHDTCPQLMDASDYLLSCKLRLLPKSVHYTVYNHCILLKVKKSINLTNLIISWWVSLYKLLSERRILEICIHKVNTVLYLAANCSGSFIIFFCSFPSIKNNLFTNLQLHTWEINY